MNNIDKQYTDLLKDILENGHIKSDRTGTGTISVYGRTIRHKMSEGFPLLTTKKMYFKGIVTELLWFLRGDTNIKYLVDNGCHIWDGDAYKAYKAKIIKMVESWDAKYHEVLESEANGNRPFTQEEFIDHIKTDPEFAKKWGELGPIYGKQWRSWVGYGSNAQGSISASNQFGKIDQIADVIHKLKTNPDDRGIIVSAWNVGELDQMVLRPCHNFFQFYTRELTYRERLNVYTKDNNEISRMMEKGSNGIMVEMDKLNVPKRAISLMWNQRSCDVPLGLPFNIASYALLLEIYAKMVNMVPDELIGNLGDTHIYLNQVEGVKEQIGKLSWEERKEMLTDPRDIKDFGNISPFTEKMLDWWLDCKNIPYSKRMPFELPKVVHMKTDEFYKTMSEDLSLLDHLDINDFVVTGYKSHPTIKYPLSN